jgi:hypothetical protein
MDDFDKVFNGFIVVWIIAVLASLGLLGVIIWGLIQIVPAVVDALSK